MEQLKSHRAPPCRFDFFHVVKLEINNEKLTQIRRRGKEPVKQPYILSTTARNQFGLVLNNTSCVKPKPFYAHSTYHVRGTERTYFPKKSVTQRLRKVVPDDFTYYHFCTVKSEWFPLLPILPQGEPSNDQGDEIGMVQ